MATSAASKTAHAVRDELTRQLLLEKRYDYLAGVDAEGVPKIGKGMARALAGFEFRVVVEERLEPLRLEADRVLVRADGMSFNVALIDVVDEEPLTARVQLSELVAIGEQFLDMTGTVAGNVLPVTFQVFEIFADGIAEGYAPRTGDYKRRGVRAPKVGVGVVAIDATSGATWSNYPGLVRWVHVWLAKRAHRERDMSPAERASLLEDSGFQAGKAALATGVGTGVGALVLGSMVATGVHSGQLYGAALVIVSVGAAVGSLKLCRVVHSTTVQAGVAGTATALLLVLALHHLGLGIGLGTLLTVATAALVSFGIGAVDNPQGRTR